MPRPPLFAVSLAVATLAAAAPGCGAPAVAPPAGPTAEPAPPAALHTCNFCRTTGVFRPVTNRLAAECPRCRSRERHRLMLHYVEHELKLFDRKLDVLHFSPQTAEETVFAHQPNWRYMTSTYSTSGDIQLDLTDARMADGLWDLIIVYHVLEHIPDDQKAMREMFRILRPGGRALVQVPLELGLRETYEDPSITDPRERNRHFGQHDHVRKYSVAGLRQRLEAAGFHVEAVDHAASLDPRDVEKFRLLGDFDPPMDQSIWVCTRPGAALAPEPAPPAGAPRPGTMPQ